VTSWRGTAGTVAEPPPAAWDGAWTEEGAAAAGALESATAEEVVAWALERFAGRLALVTSLQAGGIVLLDLVRRLGGEPRVLTLDTGRLPAETYDLVERVREHFGVEVEMISPRAADVERMVARGGPNLFYRSPEARHECCRVRKVEPLRRALRPFAAWMGGLRRGQSEARAATPKVAPDPLDDAGAAPRLKISPLADWSEAQVWEHVRRRRLPYHPLYDRGYLSIGCAPCTRPARPLEHPRNGRWWWEADGQRECGLHVLNGHDGPHGNGSGS
jgi:thioredoxin-dependent adenylylsulfate APS reductase